MDSKSIMQNCISILGLFIATVALAKDDFNILIMLFSIEILLIVAVWLFKVFLVEKANNIFSGRLFYFFTKSGPYTVEHKKTVYQLFTKHDMQLEKYYQLKVCSGDLSTFEDRFLWMGEGEVNISSLLPPQKVGSIWKNNLWTLYSIELGRVYTKKKIVETGAIVTGLHAKNSNEFLFLSTGVYHKMKKLTLFAKIPENLNPTRGEFAIYRNNDDGGDYIYSEPLEYNNSVGGFMKDIDWPRKGRRYVIRWSFEDKQCDN